MATMAEMRRQTRERAPKRTVVVATPLRMGGGYDGTTTDFLLSIADRPGGLKAAGVVGFIRDYTNNTELSRARLAAVFMHKLPTATDMLFLDADNALDLATWDALMAVDGDVVCVPYIRRVEPHSWTVRLSKESFLSPRVRHCAGERLLSVPGAGTGVMRISRDCMRRVWSAHEDLRGSWEGDPLGLVACFNNLSSRDPFVDKTPEGQIVEVVPELPWWAMDDYAFCIRARAAGCRVEVLVDRVSQHDGLTPEQSLAVSLWGPEGKPPRSD